jgi:hypothetical protein
MLKFNNLKEGTRLKFQRRVYQTAPICSLRQIVHIYPNELMMLFLSVRSITYQNTPTYENYLCLENIIIVFLSTPHYITAYSFSSRHCNLIL